MNKGRMQAQLDSLMGRIEAAEARVGEIDEMFCKPDYYELTPADEVRALEEERSSLQGEVTKLMAAAHVAGGDISLKLTISQDTLVNSQRRRRVVAQI